MTQLPCNWIFIDGDKCLSNGSEAAYFRQSACDTSRKSVIYGYGYTPAEATYDCIKRVLDHQTPIDTSDSGRLERELLIAKRLGRFGDKDLVAVIEILARDYQHRNRVDVDYKGGTKGP